MYARPWFALPVVLAFLLSACSGGVSLSPYRIDVRQGNMVTQEMVAQLKPAMTKDQVRFILGTPLVSDIFHADRWDYVYRFQPGRGDIQQRRLAVFFEDGKLARVAGDAVAGEPAELKEAATPRPAQVIEIVPPSQAPAAAAGAKQ